MELPSDDVGIELMNARFQEMGILVADAHGYHVAPEFLARIERAVRRSHPHADVNDPEFRRAVVRELHQMGVPAGFEEILANWVVHALRSRDWDE